MQAVTTIGLDIAKSVFQIHEVDAAGHVIVRRQLKRRYVLPFFQKLPPCLVGIEACASSHHWSRELQALGHTVRLMPPAYVRPYVKRQKNDAADAEAICEAVTRANMRFVATHMCHCIVECGLLTGTRSAEGIMASGHVNRTNRPNTWRHRPSLQREDFPCQPGAVHTWHIAAQVTVDFSDDAEREALSVIPRSPTCGFDHRPQGRRLGSTWPCRSGNYSAMAASTPCNSLISRDWGSLPLGTITP